MKRELEKQIRRLMLMARRQVNHHGHLCGYGNFPKSQRRSDGKPLSYCEIYTPTVDAIMRVRNLLKERTTP